MTTLQCKWCGEMGHLERVCPIKMRKELPIIPDRREKVTGMILNNYLVAHKKDKLSLIKKVFYGWWNHTEMANIPPPGTFKWADYALD